MEGTPESRPAQSHQSTPNWVHVTGNSLNVATPSSADSAEQHSPPTKRRKDGRERSRVSRACDRCKRKKIRCTGKCPCPLCLRAGLPCEFTASYTRGRLPSVVVDEEAMAAMSQSKVSMQRQTSTSDTSPPEAAVTPSFQFPKFPARHESQAAERSGATDTYGAICSLPVSITAPNDDSARDTSSRRTSPEPTQTDQQGHYIGPSSGVSFLLRIQKKLHENSSLSHNSSIFTFGDSPLPEFDPTFFVLPPKADAQRLVERYFDFAAPTHRFLHRPTVEKMLNEFYETQGDMRTKEDAASRTALLLMVFAQGRAYMPPATTAEDNSVRYYFAAENQLAKERGSVRLASVQARLVQCYYLLAQSRINQCWSLFGTTAHLALAIGLNRGRRADANGKVDYIDLECRRRTFWSAYVLDKFLAAALGRPRTLRDEDIDQELPSVINDDDLHPHTIFPSSSKTQSIMMAPVEHIRLCRIVEAVLRDLYPIRPPSMSLRIELATKYSQELSNWRTRLVRFLDGEGVDSALLIPIYQRQRNVLNLAYYHCMLLIHRPFLLSNFASLSHIDTRSNANSKQPSPSPNPSSATQQANIDACLEAAMGIVRIVDDIFQSSQIFRAFWFTQYYAFCAVVVLYIYRIQQHTSMADPAKCDGYFLAGQKCQAQLSSLGDTDCLSKRYCLVLEELRLEAARQTGRGVGALPEIGVAGSKAPVVPPAQVDVLQGSATHSPSFAVPHAGQDIAAQSKAMGDATNAFQPAFYGATIPSTPFGGWNGDNGFVEDLTSWGQFDSLVTAGIGVLDGGGGFQGDGGVSGMWGQMRDAGA